SGWLVQPARRGFFASPRRMNATVRLLSKLEKWTAPKEPAWGALRIDVWGTRDGREEHRFLCGIGQMRDSTGLSLSIGAQMLGRRQLTVEGGGVFAPEGCLQTEPFIVGLQEKGIG